MRRVSVIVAAIAVIFAVAGAGPAGAATKKQQQPARTARGTVIQPTRTIIHYPNGTTTVIEVPRRSYLDVGNEVSPGDGSYQDYAFPPDGDPGRPYWFYGPDVRGAGSFPLPPAFYIPGYNPNNPF
jgi:hypothetical protein